MDLRLSSRSAAFIAIGLLLLTACSGAEQTVAGKPSYVPSESPSASNPEPGIVPADIFGPCATSDLVPIGEVTDEDSGFGAEPVLGRECFDLYGYAADGWSNNQEQSYVVEEFCEKLGIEAELNSLLGHGLLRAGSFYVDSQINGEIGGILSGSCTFGIPRSQVDISNLPVASESIIFNWAAENFSTSDVYKDFLRFAGEDGYEPRPLVGVEDIADSAVSGQKSETQINFAARLPDSATEQIFASIGIDFTDARTQAATTAAAASPGWLRLILQRGEKLMEAYRDGSGYELYASYPN